MCCVASKLVLSVAVFKKHVLLWGDRNRQRNEDRVTVYQMFCDLHCSDVS